MDFSDSVRLMQSITPTTALHNTTSELIHNPGGNENAGENVVFVFVSVVLER